MHDHAQSEIDRKESELRDGYRSREELANLKKTHIKIGMLIDFILASSESQEETFELLALLKRKYLT